MKKKPNNTTCFKKAMPHPYFLHYPEDIQTQVNQLIDSKQLRTFFLSKYPTAHQFKSDTSLFKWVTQLKTRYLKKAPPLSSVRFEKQKDLVRNALGVHIYKQQRQGNKLKAKHHINIADQLKCAPEPVLKALVVHELAHFKEKDHNKAFYQLCCHMQSNYHQMELELRLFIVMCDTEGNPY